MTTRRQFVAGSAVGSASLLVSPSRAGAAISDAETNSWEAFLSETKSFGKAMLQRDKSQIDAYLHFLASRILQRRDIPANKLMPVPWANPPIESGAEKSGPPFTIIEFKLAPGAYLPPHNHPNTSVCTIMLEGEATVDNFEFHGGLVEPGEAGEFKLLHTKREQMKPRQVNLVLPDQNNLHSFRAGAHGARGIDLTSMHGPSAKFGFIRLRGLQRPGELVSGEWFDPKAA